MHSSTPTSTNPSNNLISTPDKSLQNGVVQQQPSVPPKSELSGQEIAGTSPINKPTTTTNPMTSGNELKQQGLVDSNNPGTNPPTSNTQPSGTQPNQEQSTITPIVVHQ
jgi:hypothetical protein